MRSSTGPLAMPLRMVAKVPVHQPMLLLAQSTFSRKSFLLLLSCFLHNHLQYWHAWYWHCLMVLSIRFRRHRRHHCFRSCCWAHSIWILLGYCSLNSKLLTNSNLVYSAIITGFVYPVVSHWGWTSEGWLQSGAPWDGVGFTDFAGSGIVHACGGIAALMGAVFIGPRVGKFSVSWFESSFLLINLNFFDN